MREPTVAAKDRPKVTGGKARARLLQFELERDIPATLPEASPQGRRAAKAPFATAAPPAAERTTDVGAVYRKALEAKSKLDQKAAKGLAVPVPIGWRPLGPFSVPHGQTYGSGTGSRPAIAGRVSSVAVDPANPAHLLVGAGGGGVWQSLDTGATWQPVTDSQPALATGAISFAPSAPGTVYVGTGEGDFYSRLGVGLLKSTDGGNNYTLLASATFAGKGFYDIAVHPLNASKLLAATTGGLYASTDGGANWSQRRTQRTFDLSVQAPVAGTAENSFEALAGCADGVFRSTDAGQTWTSVALPGAPATWDRVEVCHAPSNPDVAYVFAASGSNVLIWRRTLMGGAFSAVAPPAGLTTGQAWYDWFAGVQPNNPDVLYVAGVHVFKGVLAAGTWTWVNVSSKTSGDSIHPDQHAIAFSPTDPNVVYVGNDGGVFRSPDGGVSWTSLNKNLCIAEFEYLASHPQYDAWILGGTQDNGTLRYEGGEVWYHVADGDGGDCAINTTSPYTCYQSYYGLGLARSTSGGGWASFSGLPLPVTGSDSSLFYPPMEANGATVCQAGSRAFLSRDSGTTWTAVALPSPEIASALVMPTPDRLYVGTISGRIYRIDFTGGAWSAPVALGQPRAGYCSDLLAQATNPNRVWATYSSLTGGHVFRSDNAGTSWTDVSGGLPVIPANAIEVDPANPDTVYVAMDLGVYRSTNAGGAWASYSNKLPNALAKDLSLHGPTRLLRVGLQSRGVWEIPIDDTSMQDVEVYLRDSHVDTGRRTPSLSGVADPFAQGSTTFWWQCRDIKVDSPGYQTTSIADVDFARFEDDHGVFAAGLLDEGGQTQRNRVARVFVQVHNRGINPAQDVAIKVFYADASVGLPDLPPGFWTGFPNNTVPASSPWQPIAPHVVVPVVPTGRGQMAAFDWNVPGTAAGHSCLLAITSAANDPISTSEHNIATLVTGNKRAGLKNLTVVNPPPSVGPRVHAIKLNVWRTNLAKSLVLGPDRRAAGLVKGLVLSKRLADHAEELKLPRIEPDEQAYAALKRLAETEPEARKRLQLDAVYAPPRRKLWFDGFELPEERPEMLVLLLAAKAPVGDASIVQYDEDGHVIGGYTLRVNRQRRLSG
jgi:hypothetical protein